MTDDEMTQRERRRQQFEKEKKKTGDWLTPERFKGLIIPAIVVLIIGGIVAGMVANQASADDCPGHWHAEFYVVVDDARMSFQHPAYDLAPRGDLPISYHMHQSNDHQIHFEPPGAIQCQRMGDFFDLVDTHLSDDQLVLDGGHQQLGQAGTFQENETYKVQAYHTPSGRDNDWRTIDADDLLDRQPEDGERILILVGEYTDQEITSWQQAVPSVTGFDPNHPG